MEQAPSLRVAVIGAGPCGLSALVAFSKASARCESDRGCEVVCFEKQSQVGGLWNFTWRTGLDEYGEPLHNGMYGGLWSNGPKEALEFADYTFEEHFGTPIPSYPPREVLHNYIVGRAAKFGVLNQVRLNTVVRNVSYNEASRKFTVAAHDRASDSQTSEEFDYVIVASGHFSTPSLPEFPGLSQFPGRVLHSHDFRQASEFANKDVLVIGASYSAEDIALQCHKFGARSITLSYRTQPMTFDWPDNFRTVPLLQRVEGRSAHFADGSAHEVDAIQLIILCTGYQHHFPFMADGLRLKTGNRLWPDGLHKGIFWMDNPRLVYLGMADQFYTFNMFDVQAWYARDVILGLIKLPGRPAMDAEFAEWRAREEALVTDEDMIVFQGDHVKDLAVHTDYPGFDVGAVNKLFLDWEHNKHHGILTYRNHSHKSAMTGTQAPVYPVEWLQATDDSLKAFLAAGAVKPHPITSVDGSVSAKP